MPCFDFTRNVFLLYSISAYSQDDVALNLPVASCLVTKASIDSKDVIRPYTPTSPENTKGSFDLIVKR